MPPLTICARNASPWLLALTFFLLPAMGASSPELVQDTLKSAILAGGTLLAAMAFFASRLWLPQTVLAKHPLSGHPILWVPVACCVYAGFSALWSHAYLASADAIRWAVIGLLAWLSMHAIRQRELNYLLWALHGGASCAALWAAGQFWFDFSAFEQGPGPAATFYNRNFYAEFTICVLPYSAWLLARTTSRWGQWGLALSIAFNLATLCMTSTRSALLALAVIGPVLAGLAWMHYRQSSPGQRRTLRWRSVLCSGLWLLLVNLPSNGQHVDNAPPHTTAWQRSLHHTAELGAPGGLQAGSASIRLQMWLATLRMVAAQPLGGVGAGAWEVQIPRYQAADTELEIDYFAHNEFLQLLSEYGLVVGGLALALLLAQGIQWAQACWRARPAAPAASYPVLSLAAFAVVAVAGYPLHLATTCGLFGLSLGLACQATTHLPSAPDAPASSPIAGERRWLQLALVLLCVSALGAAYVIQRAVRAEAALVRALDMAAQLPRTAAPMDVGTQQRKDAMLAQLHRGMALNPHYRKFFPVAAEVLMTEQDWHNAATVLEAGVATRPYVYALWKGLAQARIGLRQGPEALAAAAHLRALRPQAATTQLLTIEALSVAGDEAQALALTRESMAHPVTAMEPDLLEAGYAMGLKHQDRALALRALTLRKQYWPESAADSYLRMGNLYAGIAPVDATRALQAYREGLTLVPAADAERFIALVAPAYRSQLHPMAHR